MIYINYLQLSTRKGQFSYHADPRKKTVLWSGFVLHGPWPARGATSWCVSGFTTTNAAASCGLSVWGYLRLRGLLNVASSCCAAARSRASDSGFNVLTPLSVCDARHGSPASCNLSISRVRLAFVMMMMMSFICSCKTKNRSRAPCIP